MRNYDLNLSIKKNKIKKKNIKNKHKLHDDKKKKWDKIESSKLLTNNNNLFRIQIQCK